jgi:hypothetical protein
MLFTDPIMTIHVNRIVDRPSMNSIDTGGYKSIDAEILRGGYRKPSVVIARIPDHKNGHAMRLNKVALKYLDFLKNVDLGVHVRVFNSTVKANAKASEKYIINVFNYTLKDISSNWCHIYMSNFLDYIFLELTQAFCKCHWKTQNDEQIYMELKNMK